MKGQAIARGRPPGKAVRGYLSAWLFYTQKEFYTDASVLVVCSDRRVIELAKASKSLEEAARIMKRTPARIRKVSMRLGVSFKAAVKKK
jgi:hypothetical protein